ncbi:MAG: hypothetical protein WCR47_05910 [Desulfoplanes sp.]
MGNNKFQGSLADLWRSVQMFLNRMGIHPLVAFLGVILLIIFPRFIIFGLIIYALYWLYRNGGFSGRNNASGQGKSRGGRGGKGRHRR